MQEILDATEKVKALSPGEHWPPKRVSWVSGGVFVCAREEMTLPVPRIECESHPRGKLYAVAITRRSDETRKKFLNRPDSAVRHFFQICGGKTW